jgi:hypothetical protein
MNSFQWWLIWIILYCVVVILCSLVIVKQLRPKLPQTSVIVKPLSLTPGISESYAVSLQVVDAPDSAGLNFGVERPGQPKQALELKFNGELVYSKDADFKAEKYAPGWTRKRAIACSEYILEMTYWSGTMPIQHLAIVCGK